MSSETETYTLRILRYLTHDTVWELRRPLLPVRNAISGKWSWLRSVRTCLISRSREERNDNRLTVYCYSQQIYIKPEECSMLLLMPVMTNREYENEIDV